ncbi:conserved hypothetical protein; putative membrane protein [Cupriavidus phytorum]|uniref:DUF2628 domain-containing protein n=2 Tax=Cupriavidus TaxID=106589 RepID=A0A375CLX4_9BURK|nr:MULTISPECIES: DUF2628 domain-containing protein [Cupriavidus]PZX27068.1 uncharacterized protein DUF2628 [Cupriavidus alkaliphilus]SOY75153.1 conserved hypothetical protein; putative membrane protein [Cupriavidus taiwanensis]
MHASIRDDAALAAFVGPRFPYYGERWSVAETHGGISWNWAACLLGPFWMAYRRMYWQVGVYALIVGTEPLLHAVFGLQLPMAGRPLLYAMALLLGLYGNELYRWHAEATIRHVREYHYSPELVTDSLERRGRTSWPGVFAMGLLLLVMVVSLRPLAALMVQGGAPGAG